MQKFASIIAALCFTALNAGAALAEPLPVYGAVLEGFDYPFQVEHFNFNSQGQSLSMAFMDVKPQAPNGRTIVLFHGKNFCAATWDTTITALRFAGYRVIAIDQIGFCKSSKPEHYQYSFAQLAENTRALLKSRGIEHAIILGHSMGGMLAIRYALMFPEAVDTLVLVDPLGLEDWQAAGVPYASIDSLFDTELKTSAESIKAYQRKFYYHGEWRPDYDRWVYMLAGMFAGAGKASVAWSQALTSDMIFTQPVVHELSRVKPRTVLMIGGRDRTAPGANRAPPDVAARLGRYPELARRAVQMMQHAQLTEFPELGHAPQVEAPEQFQRTLIEVLQGE
ncbi:MAG TPA: alpha/beta hydrolase [Pseudolabrys sp.]|nr:alpha/beta hydrolase [Pseudolabrys sp.]